MRSEAGEPPRRQNVFRDREAGKPEPVEYAAGAKGVEVGGEVIVCGGQIRKIPTVDNFASI